MALKYLILLLVVVLAFWWLGRRRDDGQGAADAGRAPRAAAGAGSAQASRAARTMVACAHCGVLLPRGESLQAGAESYCGEAHRALGPRAGGGA